MVGCGCGCVRLLYGFCLFCFLFCFVLFCFVLFCFFLIATTQMITTHLPFQIPSFFLSQAFHTEDLPLVDGRTTNDLNDGPSSLQFQSCCLFSSLFPFFSPSFLPFLLSLSCPPYRGLPKEGFLFFFSFFFLFSSPFLTSSQMTEDGTSLAEKMLTGIYGSHMVMRVKVSFLKNRLHSFLISTDIIFILGVRQYSLMGKTASPKHLITF